MPDIYKNNDNKVPLLPCHHNWLVWERVWDSRTVGTKEPLKEIGRYRLCLRRKQSKLPPWEYSDSDKARHRLPKCDTCPLYKHDTPDTRDRHYNEEFGPVQADLVEKKDYNPDKHTEPKQIDDSIPF